jgi:hypothetical protein
MPSCQPSIGRPDDGGEQREKTNLHRRCSRSLSAQRSTEASRGMTVSSVRTWDPSMGSTTSLETYSALMFSCILEFAPGDRRSAAKFPGSPHGTSSAGIDETRRAGTRA